MADGAEDSRVTFDLDVYTVDVPGSWRRVPAAATGVAAWSSPDLVEHLIIGAYHLPGPATQPDRRAIADELVALELVEIARIGRGRVVVRQSQHDGNVASLTIVTGADGENGIVFAYYFVVSASVVLKLKLQRIGLDRSERAVLERAAAFASSLRLREIQHET